MDIKGATQNVVQQNDPTELLELFDRSGQGTGRTKTRAAIHLDGDWHQAFHCWILRRGGEQVLLQRRSLAKDTFGGCWDAAAAGHWRAGESAAEAAREIEEELGISVPFDALMYRGLEHSQRSFDNGLTDREHHQVYVLMDDRPLTSFRPNPAEVVGLAAFRLTDLIELMQGNLRNIDAQEAVSVTADGALRPAKVRVSREDMVPYSAARLRRMVGPIQAR